MRTIESWNRIQSKIIQKRFPPRIQRDVLSIIESGKLPTLPPNEERAFIYIHGEVNAGKSIVSAFLLLRKEQEMYMKGQPGECVFVNTGDLFNELKSSFQSESKQEQAILKKYQTCPLLVLDDFGTVKPTEWVYQTLYAIINYRYEYLLPTILNSNYNLKKTAEILHDERIVSRIEREGLILKKIKNV